MVPRYMNPHSMLLIAELLIIMRDHFVLGPVWLGFYILAIMFIWFLLVITHHRHHPEVLVFRVW